MKTLTGCLCLMLLFYSRTVPAQIYTPRDNGSSVQFIIKNLGFNVEGTFTHLQGSIHFDTDNLAAAGFTVTVDAATVSTGNSSRDSHLKKEEYFNVAKYPLISFSSEKIEKSATAGSYIATGKFTVKGKSKPVSIGFTASKQENGYLFKGKVTLNRRDFGVGGNSFVLSDNLILIMNVFSLSDKK